MKEETEVQDMVIGEKEPKNMDEDYMYMKVTDQWAIPMVLNIYHNILKYDG